MQSSSGWSPLCTASFHCHLKCVELILENHGRVDVLDHEGRSSLHLAAEAGSEAVCQVCIILERSIDTVGPYMKQNWYRTLANKGCGFYSRCTMTRVFFAKNCLFFCYTHIMANHSIKIACF